MRRGVTSTVVVAVVAALAATLLLVWGSSTGAPLVNAPQGSWAPPPVTLPPMEPAAQTAVPTAEGVEEPPQEVGQVIDWVLIGFVLLVVTAVLLVLKMLANRKHRGADPLPLQDDEELTALLEATGEEVRYRALTESDPRNAVVACWVALEEAVQHSGLRRDPTETAAELTSRVLGRWQVDETAIATLSAAYREARFSRHPVSEQERDRAVEALRRIHEDLRTRVLDEREAVDADASGDLPAEQDRS